MHEFRISKKSLPGDNVTDYKDRIFGTIKTELPLALTTQVSVSTIQMFHNGAPIQFTSLLTLDDNACVEIVIPSIKNLDLRSKNLTHLDDSDVAFYANLQ